MRAELTGKRLELRDTIALKPLSGTVESGRERFVFGVWKNDEVRITTLGSDEVVGFEMKLSGEGGRMAAEAVAAAISMVSEIDFIVRCHKDFRAPHSFPCRRIYGGTAGSISRHNIFYIHRNQLNLESGSTVLCCFNTTWARSPPNGRLRAARRFAHIHVATCAH